MTDPGFASRPDFKLNTFHHHLHAPSYKSRIQTKALDDLVFKSTLPSPILCPPRSSLVLIRDSLHRELVGNPQTQSPISVRFCYLSPYYITLHASWRLNLFVNSAELRRIISSSGLESKMKTVFHFSEKLLGRGFMCHHSHF